ncbi:MAG: ECF transporter S component [Bacilli bacterium]|nr:ECF transporter S component [Bacilli bacterium]
MKTQLVKRLCIDGILTALFIVISLFRIKLGFLEFGLTSLVTLLACFLLSPIDGMAVGLAGEFINQVFLSGYGLTPTTPLWVLPHVLRPLIVGLIAYFFRKGDKPFVRYSPLYFITLCGTALLISGLDTLIIWLDGIIFGYSTVSILLNSGFRVLSSQGSAVAVGLMLVPLYRVLSTLYPKEKREENEPVEESGDSK